MATIIREEKRKRGVFGTLMWWLFLAHNALMFAWLVFGMKAASDAVVKSSDAYEKAGATIGTAVAFGMVLSIWVIGDIILGMIVALSRGKKITLEKTID